ncbi:MULTISPECIES: sigma-70 family RNA polymerase sigma factor [Nocardioides]|uniref:RNA polymerase sigma factor n=1 Tax=Nocardioides vastitatis TaxID=2568655 RepID=A0ABW0ZAY3_9ACTN|nr:sigma-70 family RNA polymerase sigma factor [Nocardioides sp.]THJ13142.1 sigma-70 family RNA polymerase sigma factor [Nocardioides sp.]
MGHPVTPSTDVTAPRDAGFTLAAVRHRGELIAHCYRMLGSPHDAEDVVQETYLRAWRSFGSYDASRASLRTWLYRIATNACLTALDQRQRRALPSGLGAPSDDPQADLRAALPDAAWVQPVPDSMVTSDPAAVVADRASLRLALVVAYQHLPARQRAALLLCDVLRIPAAEAAEILDTSPAAINSSLQRARAHLRTVAPDAECVAEPNDAAARAILDRYARAFEHADLADLGAVLREDVVWEMPPVPDWFLGRDRVLALVAGRCPAFAGRPGGSRMVRIRANAQAAFAMYTPEGDYWTAHSIHVLDLAGDGVARVVDFQDPGLFATFGLSATTS